ncbi:MAG: GntR family transcriptional regulator [Acidimicrobiia bacterium]
MLVSVDPDGDQAIYLQISADIESQVSEGKLEPGERLPSARSLAASLGVNMHTVLKAYSHLQDLGLVELRRGRGGAVVRPAPDVARLVGDLVDAARGAGLTAEELQSLIEEAWP